MGIARRLREEFSIFSGNYLILIVSWVIMDFFNEIPTSFFELYVLELGGTAVTIGLINFSLKIAFASVSFPGGYIADKYGRKGILIFSTLAMSFNFMIFAIAPDWRFLLLAMVTGNLLRISNPALQAITADSLPSKKRGVGYSIQQITLDLTSTPAPLLAGLMFSYYGFVTGMRLAYVLVALTYIIGGVLRYRLKETLETTSKIELKELVKAFPLSYIESIKMLFRIPRSLRYYILTSNVFSFSFSLIYSFIIVYVTTDLGLSKIQWSILLTVQAVVAIILMIPIGKVIDRLGGKPAIMLTVVVEAITLALIVHGNFYMLLVVVPLFGLSGSAASVASQKLVADLTPRNLRGKMAGLTRFFTLIVGAVGSLLGGIIYQGYPHVLTFVLSIAITLVGIVVFWFLVEEPEVKEE